MVDRIFSIGSTAPGYTASGSGCMFYDEINKDFYLSRPDGVFEFIAGATPASVKTDNVLHVMEGATEGTRERLDDPYGDIQSAIDDAISGDVVRIWTGTYNLSSSVNGKANVLVEGMNKETTILTTTVPNLTMYNLASAVSGISNLTMLSDAVSGFNKGISITGTANATSTCRDLDILDNGSGGGLIGIADAGTGVASSEFATLQNVKIKAAGLFASGVIKSGSGTSLYRDCDFEGFPGVAIDGTGKLFNVKCTGVVGLSVVAGATCEADSATTYSSLSNLGTFTQLDHHLGNKRLTVQATTFTPISSVSDTILLTLPAFPAQNNPDGVVLLATIGLVKTGTGASEVTFKMFRDGVEISATDRYNHAIGGTPDVKTVHIHFVDPSPGANPVYTLRAIADDNDLDRTPNSRLTAWI